jgi:hypothetical protein
MWSYFKFAVVGTIFLLLQPRLSVVSGWNAADSRLSRRSAFQRVMETTGAAIATPLLLTISSSHARLTVIDITDPDRQALLSAIGSGGDDGTVLSALQVLVRKDPSRGRGASADLLDGQWKLLWSAKAEAFSPLLQLPAPFKPASYQYIGQPAASQVGDGRIAQTLSGGILGPLQLWLSSGVIERSDNAAQLEVATGTLAQTKKIRIVDANSDAEFRAVNARTSEAQQAPPNLYQQVYVENGPHALRISTIVEGDPVIVGAIFVHQKV